VYRSAFAKGMFAVEIMNGGKGYLDFDWARWDTEGAVFVEVSGCFFLCFWEEDKFGERGMWCGAERCCAH
jgi:hypothetical protein